MSRPPSRRVASRTSPPRSPPASPTESFFQGDPSRDSPGRDAPIPELATPAEVIDEINRVRRDPAAYAAFLRSHVAPRYRLDGSYWPREAGARPHRTHDGLAACLLAVSFFFEVPGRRRGSILSLLRCGVVDESSSNPIGAPAPRSERRFASPRARRRRARTPSTQARRPSPSSTR